MNTHIVQGLIKCHTHRSLNRRLTLRFPNSLEEAVYGVGMIKMGMDFKTVRSASDSIDCLRHFGVWHRHRKAGRALLKEHPFPNPIIDPQRGCGIIPDGLIDNFEPLLEKARRISREAADRVEQPKDEPYINALDDQTLAENPDFFALAAQPRLIAAVTKYLGILPQIRNISILLSRPSVGQFSSMNWHLDKLDSGLLGFWVNLFDMPPETGPFSYIPADWSDKVRTAYDYDRKTYLGQTRVSDADLSTIVPTEKINSVGGPAFSSRHFVDTSRCFHMGGRCRAGIRANLHIRYALPHKIEPTYRERLLKAAGNDSWHHKLLLM